MDIISNNRFKKKSKAFTSCLNTVNFKDLPANTCTVLKFSVIYEKLMPYAVIISDEKKRNKKTSFLQFHLQWI